MKEHMELADLILYLVIYVNMTFTIQINKSLQLTYVAYFVNYFYSNVRQDQRKPFQDFKESTRIWDKIMIQKDADSVS